MSSTAHCTEIETPRLSIWQRLLYGLRQRLECEAVLEELEHLSPALLADIGAEDADLRVFARAAVRGDPLPTPITPRARHRLGLPPATVAFIRIGSI